MSQSFDNRELILILKQAMGALTTALNARLGTESAQLNQMVGMLVGSAHSGADALRAAISADQASLAELRRAVQNLQKVTQGIPLEPQDMDPAADSWAYRELKEELWHTRRQLARAEDSLRKCQPPYL